MKKIISALLVAALLLPGCSLFKKDPQEVVDKGVQRFAEVEKMHSKMILSGTIQAPQGEVPAAVRFTIEMNGQTDISDEESPIVDTSLKLSASADDKGGSGEITFRTINKKAFVNLVGINIPGENGEALATQLTSVLNKWWSIPVQDGKNPLGRLADEQKEIQEKLKTTQFFINAQEIGEGEVEGISATQYKVDLSNEAIKSLILDFARLGGTALTPEEEIAIGDSLKDVAFSGAVWIGDDKVLHKIAGTMTVQPAQGPSTSFDIDYSAWDYGKKVVVDEPADAQEFNPMMMLPLLGALSAFDQPVDSTAPEGEPIDQPLGADQVEGE